MQDHGVDVSGQAWVESAWRLWLDLEVLIHHLRHPPGKRWAARQQLKGHDRQRILIGSRNRMALPLLRSHVEWRAANGLAHACCHRRDSGDAKVRQHEVG